MGRRRIITLTSDYGNSGIYVGAVKASILRVDEDASIVDITHSLPRGNVDEAAFVIGATYSQFSSGTIHVILVDPGVGSSRRLLLTSTENYTFISPDTGLLRYVLRHEEVYATRELTEENEFLSVRKTIQNNLELTSEEIERAASNPKDPSWQLMGRAAGWLSKGGDAGLFGGEITDFFNPEIPQPVSVQGRAFKGTILYIDHFGNIITNFTQEQIPIDQQGYPLMAKLITSGRTEITEVRQCYGERQDSVPFLMPGSFGYYEIAVNGGSAADILGLKVGNEIGVLLK